MRRSLGYRLWALALALVMAASLVPISAFAETDAAQSSWTKVEWKDIKDGDVFAITMTKDDATWALPTTGGGSGGQPLAVKATVDDDTLTADGAKADFGWTRAAVKEADGYTLAAADDAAAAAKYLYLTASNNGVQIGDTAAAWTLSEATETNGSYLTAKDSSGTTRYLGVYSERDWRCYTSINANISGQKLEFWKFAASEEGSGADEPVIDTIADALAGENGTKFTVKGVVTLVDGRNIYIQDETGGICLYFSAAPTDIQLGDTVIGTGSRAEYRKLPELSGATFTTSSGITLSPKAMSAISDIKEADVCTYISLKGVEVTDVFDNNGQYAAPNITVKDAAGSTIQIYKAVVEKAADGTWAVKAGDKVDVKAAVGINNTTLQLRNTLSSEITAAVPDEPETPDEIVWDKLTSAPADGSQVVLHYPASNMALTATASGKKLAGTEAVPAEGKLTVTEDMAVLTVAVKEDVYTFEADGTFLTSAETGNGLSFDKDGSSELAQWKLEAQEDGTWYLMNVGANYNGNHNQALEYYNGFTTYGVKANNAAYKFDFYGENAAADPVSGLKTGDVVAIFNDGNAKAMTADVSDSRLKAVDASLNKDNELVGEGIAELTVTVNEDGTVMFANGGKFLTSGETGQALSFADKESEYSLWVIEDAGDGLYFLKNANANYNGNAQYMEYYNTFTTYGKKATADPKPYAMSFRTLAKEESSDGPLVKGNSYVVYNASSEGVFGIPNDMGNAMTLVGATIENETAIVENGALVLTVADVSGKYYTFETGGKYLATNDAEDLFLQDKQDEYTQWYLTKNGDGYLIYNKTANYNGTPVCIEFFSGSFSGWTFKSSDAAIFRFNFYPLAEGTAVVDGVAQVPTVEFSCEDSRYMEQDYAAVFTLNDLAPEISSVTATYTAGNTRKTVAEFDKEGNTYRFIIPAADLDAAGAVESFDIVVEAVNSYQLSYSGTKTVTVLDEPFIGVLTPAANAQTMDDKRPEISAEIGNAGENAVFKMTLNDEEVPAVYADGKLAYTAASDMADGRYTAAVSVTRTDGKSAEKSWSFYVGKSQYQLYFGQLHSHTTYSDGSGTLEAALDYISKLPASANVQFVAFTDHSNYFDTTSAANPEAALYDVSQMTAASKEIWDKYKKTVDDFNASQSNIVAIAGFEMTWSGGPGHINTFNSPGIVSRNNSTLNNKTNDAGMKAYYALLNNEQLSGALSQFNHPGKTFGNFTDFSYWDALTDTRMYLVEVGNGEGQIGAGGYYPSYEQYIMALDKGWHVAPTNNQDNHKGRWGNANDARDVIITDDFSEQGIYNAIHDYHVYATEDKNLEIQYTVNGEMMGTIFSDAPEKLNFSVSLYDPDSSDAIDKVELVANSGAVAHTWSDATELGTGLLEAELDPTYTYYFVRVTQKDGDLAVTAPVWVGESLKLGISAVDCSASTPVTGEEFTLSTTLFNSEAAAATIKSLTYTTNGSVVIGTMSDCGSIPSSGNAVVDFAYTPDKAKVMDITVTAIVEMEGVEYTFTKEITLEVKDADSLVYIGIDASHYNEYVAGNYKDSMGNFGELAAGCGVRTVELKTSEELIAACGNEKYAAMIFTAPSRRLAAAQSDPKTYSAEELAAIKAFNDGGGMVVVAGWGDNYENYAAVKDTKHMAATQNELLAALGSSLLLGDDELMDDELNGGQAQRLYFSDFNMDSFLMDGVEVDPEHPDDRAYSEVYSHYGGSSVYFSSAEVPATVTPVVYGHASTYTKDCDGDGKNDLAYPYQDGSRFVALATEQIEGKGLIVASGAAFMSNFEVQAAASSGAADADQQKNYANYKICENLLKGFNEVKVTPIEEVQAQTEVGLVYTIEGTVTSNASGYDKDTAFFDCIYVQDETAGICCFPVSGNFKIGDTVRIKGYTDFYQAEMELQVMTIEKTGETDPVEPQTATAAEINDLSKLGSLVTLSGTVESFELENGLVQTILVKDEAGNVARVFIDGYITTAEDVADLSEGCEIEATGLSSYDDTWKDANYFPRIRIRDRADIVCTPVETADEPSSGKKDKDKSSGTEKTLRFKDVAKDDYFFDAVYWAVQNGVTAGTSETTFSPYWSCTRAQMVTFLWAAVGAPDPGTVDCPFTDLVSGAYYEKAVLWAYANDITAGVSADKFGPEQTVTRAQVATFLYGVAGRPEAGSEPFADVADSDWFEAPVAWAYNKGITSGTGNGRFSPDADCLRGQIVTFLYLYFAE